MASRRLSEWISKVADRGHVRDLSFLPLGQLHSDLGVFEPVTGRCDALRKWSQPQADIRRRERD